MYKSICMSVLTLMFTLSANAKPAGCLKECDPEVSKPCGKGCIARELDCHKPTTRACFGEKGKSTKKVYAEPKYVESKESK